MTGRYFLDTNVLFYAEDPRDPAKQKRARDLIRAGFTDGLAWISLQVLQEFFSSTTKKLRLPVEDARRRVELYSRHLSVVQMGPADLLSAIDLHRQHQLSIWDSLIIQASSVPGCDVIYTEDLQDGLILGETRIVNPFRA
jgi:predicted nucleic acid-binding protein